MSYLVRYVSGPNELSESLTDWDKLSIQVFLEGQGFSDYEILDSDLPVAEEPSMTVELTGPRV